MVWHFAKLEIGLLLIAALCLVSGAQAEQPRRDVDSHFDRAVAPLLKRSCLGCHSGSKPKGGLDLTRRSSALAGGKHGPAIVPGETDGSLVWKRVAAAEMPPKKPLSQSDRAVLEEWIATGATWGRDLSVPAGNVAQKQDGSNWWSLQPLRRPEVPSQAGSPWLRNPIDHFVLAKLIEKGLQPSPEADRRTLIRRLYFDLVGLPPSPEEVRAFLDDREPQPYERLVDRLLASPHYGERWARHWLDVVHYGETHGYDKDKPRENAWPYRDYVIRALNDDKPYGRFVQEQIAGDVLFPGARDGIEALGFIAAGPGI
jgi:hypothetical protein